MKNVLPVVPQVVVERNILGPLLESENEVFLSDLIPTVTEAVRTRIEAIDQKCSDRRSLPILVYTERNCVPISSSHGGTGR
jgi:hypothetical protein